MDTAAAFSISPDELRALLGRADAPLLLDVRRPPKFRASDRMLPGALYCAPEAVAEFAAARAPRDVVTYCVYGHEVSHVAAQVLRDAGWNARWLAGGIEGGEPGVDAEEAIAGWRAHPLPTVPKRPDTEPSA